MHWWFLVCLIWKSVLVGLWVLVFHLSRAKPLWYLIFFSPLSSSTLSLLIIVLHNIVIIIIYAASCIVSICFFCSLLSRACWHKRRFFEREFSSGFSPQNPGSSKIPTVVFLQLVVQLYSSPMQQPASLFAGTHLVTPFLQRLLFNVSQYRTSSLWSVYLNYSIISSGSLCHSCVCLRLASAVSPPSSPPHSSLDSSFFTPILAGLLFCRIWDLRPPIRLLVLTQHLTPSAVFGFIPVLTLTTLNCNLCLTLLPLSWQRRQWNSSPSELTPALASYSGGKLVALYWAPNAVFSVFFFYPVLSPLTGSWSFYCLSYINKVSLPVLRRWLVVSTSAPADSNKADCGLSYISLQTASILCAL